ncbi:MAG: PAS-domain containing protein [Alphaproteobacteria bacterium]
MTKSVSNHKHGFLTKLLAPLGFSCTREKARLEAFLSAFPGEYCGWSESDSAIAYSQSFCDMLGLKTIEKLTDIQSKLSPGDAAALEGLFERLEQTAAPFTTHAKNHDGSKIFKISGAQGQSTDAQDRFNILWLEDVSETFQAREAFKQEAEVKAKLLKQLQVAFNALPQPRWMRDKNGKILWINEAYSDAAGLTISTILNEQKELPVSTRKTKSAKDTPLLGPALAAKALQSGEKQQSQAHISIGGKRLLMRIIETPLPQLEMTLGLCEDISREEELETSLKRHQSSNIELLEQLRTAIAIYGAEEQLEFYNSAFSQLWGLEDGWLNTRPRLGDIMEKLRDTRRLPEQADFRKFKQSWLGMFTTLIQPHDEMLYLPDGTALRMLVIPHSMGGLMMTFEDVTSRLELESSYNTLIAVQKETLDNLGEAVAVFGGDGRLKLSNPAFGRLWNLNPELLEGQPHISKIVEKLENFFTKEEWPRRQKEFAAKALDRMMHEGRLKRTDNTLVDFTTVPLPDGGVLITYIDVTDTVRVENALREKNAALEAAEQLKLDFLANVSYQLRTPLNAIMGFNEILDQEYFGPLNKRQKEYTRDTRKASERLLELINDILDLATLEAGYLTLQREDISVYTLMTGIKELVDDWARKAEIEIQLKCAKNIGKITVDEKRLKQAIINIIRNAINFTPAGGKITLSAHKLKEGIEISVRDTGIGIRKEDKLRVFEPFERAQSGLQNAKTPRTGAGLGLSLVKNIISLHGGQVDLESQPGKGTTVTIFIPFTSFETPFKIPKTAKKAK